MNSDEVNEYRNVRPLFTKGKAFTRQNANRDGGFAASDLDGITHKKYHLTPLPQLEVVDSGLRLSDPDEPHRVGFWSELFRSIVEPWPG